MRFSVSDITETYPTDHIVFNVESDFMYFTNFYANGQFSFLKGTSAAMSLISHLAHFNHSDFLKPHTLHSFCYIYGETLRLKAWARDFVSVFLLWMRPSQGYANRSVTIDFALPGGSIISLEYSSFPFFVVVLRGVLVVFKDVTMNKYSTNRQILVNSTVEMGC